MNKASSKLAAGVRKVKTQESSVEPAQPAPHEAEAPAAEKHFKPAPAPRQPKPVWQHPERVWPD